MGKMQYHHGSSKVIAKVGYDVNDCSFDELVQLANHYNQMATDIFYEDRKFYTSTEQSAIVSYYLNVAERYSKELKNRAILTSI